MKTTKNQTVKEKEAVIINAAKGNLEKMKCIKNTITGKVQRVKLSVANDIIRNDDNWHFTSKTAYERALCNEIPKGTSLHPNVRPIEKMSKVKGQRKDMVEKQRIVEVLPNPDYKEPTLVQVFKSGKGDEQTAFELNSTPVYSKVKETKPYTTSTHAEVGIAGDCTAKEKEVVTSINIKVPSNKKGVIIGYSRVPKFITKIKYVWHLIVDGKRVKPLVK